MEIEYKVGDRINYTCYGCNRTVTVTDKLDDIKEGYSGFDGVTDDGKTVWGYDYQIKSKES